LFDLSHNMLFPFTVKIDLKTGNQTSTTDLFHFLYAVVLSTRFIKLGLDQ